MSHPEQRVFIESVKTRFPTMFKDVRVLEIGSLNINGSVRDFFTDGEYIGVDLQEGPGVDVIGQGQDLDYPDKSFDVVISAECFEHNPYWYETFQNMTRMTRVMVIFTCATHGRAEHGTARTTPANSPFTVNAGWDYYRNLGVEDFDADWISNHYAEWQFSTNDLSHDLYFWGIIR